MEGVPLGGVSVCGRGTQRDSTVCLMYLGFTGVQVEGTLSFLGFTHRYP